MSDVVLRQMAWERAKGELRGILHTYIKQYHPNKTFLGVRSKIKNFIYEMDVDIGKGYE